MSHDNEASSSTPVSILSPNRVHHHPSPARTSSTSSLPTASTGVSPSPNGSTDQLSEIPMANKAPSFRASLMTSNSINEAVMPLPSEVGGGSTPEADAQILEALKSKDRLFVLKLGEQMEALIRERSSRLSFQVSPENQYQRLLVHRCAQYYKMSPENDPQAREKAGSRDMVVVIMTDSRVPVVRISDLVPAEQTPLPAFKIMRRSDLDRRRQKSTFSRPESAVGEDGELSDPEPSEAGSMGSRSTTSKKHMTIAEREAAYEVARNRIFMHFEEKEKAKERDTSASSSTFSLVSASGSGSQSGGAGCSSDIEDNVSTAPTESEWSVPGTDRRRGGDTMNVPDIPRNYPIRPSDADEHASGSASPSFTYPSLYDPSAPQPSIYDQPATYPPPAQGTYAPSTYPMYPHPFPPTAHAMNSPPTYLPYQYFTQYPYASSPQHQFPTSDPNSPANGAPEAFPTMPAQQPGSMPYAPATSYSWMPPMQRQGSSDSQSSVPTQTPPGQVSQMIFSPQFPPYIATHSAVPYTIYPPYYNHSQQPHPHMMMHAPYPMEAPPSNGSASDRGGSSGMSSGHGSPSPTLSRDVNSSGSSSNGYHTAGSSGLRRGGLQAPGRGRGSYSYSSSVAPSPSPGIRAASTPGETVGPRLSSSLRRTSGSSSGYKPSGEDAISVASSSSSSTRKTVTSTPPKHPLPARPDWAAGIKAQPTLHQTVRQRHDSNSSRTMSPAKVHQNLYQNHGPGSHQHQRPQPVSLHSTDFPPLSSVPGPGVSRPVMGGVWGSIDSSAKATSAYGPSQPGGGALFSHATANRLEDDERGFERPPPKSSAELFNPKSGLRRPTISQNHSQSPQGLAQARHTLPSPPSVEEQAMESARVKEAVASAILVERAAAMKIQDASEKRAEEHEGTPRAESLLSQAQAQAHDSIM